MIKDAGFGGLVPKALYLETYLAYLLVHYIISSATISTCVSDKLYTDNIPVSFQAIVRRCRYQCKTQTWLDSTHGGSHQPK